MQYEFTARGRSLVLKSSVLGQFRSVSCITEGERTFVVCVDVDKSFAFASHVTPVYEAALLIALVNCYRMGKHLQDIDLISRVEKHVSESLLLPVEATLQKPRMCAVVVTSRSIAVKCSGDIAVYANKHPRPLWQTRLHVVREVSCLVGDSASQDIVFTITEKGALWNPSVSLPEQSLAPLTQVKEDQTKTPALSEKTTTLLSRLCLMVAAAVKRLR